MFFKDIVKTFLSKGLILFLNFLILILTTNFWGTEGRGIISIIMADLAIIAIFNNVLAGSSITYLIPRVGLSILMLPGYIWIVFCTLVVAAFFSIFQGHHNYILIIALTLPTSFLSMNLLAFVGKEKINHFNLLNLLTPIIFLVFTLIFVYIIKIKSVNAYLYGYFVSQTIVFLISFKLLKPYIKKEKVAFSKEMLQQTFRYGLKNELSYLIQFLNYRLSYFFILYFQSIEAVGLFSVAIALAESIWLVNKSITTVQFAKIVNLIDKQDTAIELTKKSTKLSFYASVIMFAIVLLIPSKIYGLAFGHDFRMVKQLLFLLMPGILSMAISNVYGHYFAATNQMRILIMKSSLGLIITVLCSIILIPLWGLNGACIVTSISYLSSSVYLFFSFNSRK